MLRFPRIESRQNPRIKNLAKLRAAKERSAQGRFIIEGELELKRALEANAAITELYVCPDHWRSDAHASKIVAQAEKRLAKITEVTPEVFAKLTMREGPDGLLGLASQKALALESLKLPKNALVIVAEKIEKPGNLGAMIRTAEAAGAHALIACDSLADFENPHVIRNSRGLVFSLPCIRSDQAAVADFLATHKMQVIATTPDAAALHWEAQLQGPVAILAGAEHDGLSDFWLQRAETKIRIPMVGAADSLNVNTATAIVLFEALRQRR